MLPPPTTTPSLMPSARAATTILGDAVDGRLVDAEAFAPDSASPETLTITRR